MTPQSRRDPGKRIPKSLNTDANLIGTYTLSDVAVALTPGVLVILGVQWLIPPGFQLGGFPLRSLGLPLAGLGVILGSVFVVLTPSYTSSIEWLTAALTFHRNTSELDHEAARKHTLFERAHPERDAIERTDGTFLGFIEVSAPLLALATPEEWQGQAEAFADFANTTLTYPLQIYSTTRPFPVEEYLAPYRARLSDPDVQSNPRLRNLIESYCAWYEGEMESRGMTIREHYAIVPVHPREIQFTQDTPLRRLTEIPILDLFARALGPSQDHREQAVLEVLDERCQAVSTGLRSIPGCHTHRVEGTEAVTLVSEFYHGTTQTYDDLEALLSEPPIRSHHDSP